jgi:hypothetical protein
VLLLAQDFKNLSKLVGQGVTMKTYKEKTLMEWIQDIVAMDEATLKANGSCAHLTEDNRVLTGGEDWMKKEKISWMKDKIHTFTKNIETEADRRAVEDANDFVERFYFGDEV